MAGICEKKGTGASVGYVGGWHMASLRGLCQSQSHFRTLHPPSSLLKLTHTHTFELSCDYETNFSVSLQVTFTCTENLKLYSQSCVTVRLAYKGSCSSLPPAIFFFFQQLEAFPLWACDLPKGSNSSSSHNHSPQSLQVSVQSTWPPADPKL